MYVTGKFGRVWICVLQKRVSGECPGQGSAGIDVPVHAAWWSHTYQLGTILGCKSCPKKTNTATHSTLSSDWGVDRGMQRLSKSKTLSLSLLVCGEKVKWGHPGWELTDPYTDQLRSPSVRRLCVAFCGNICILCLLIFNSHLKGSRAVKTSLISTGV